MHSKKIHFIVVSLLLLLACYERGYRIAYIGEVPNSQRPASLIVNGGV